MELLNKVIIEVNERLGFVLIFLLLGVGLYFTVRSRTVQLRLLWRAIREMTGGFHHGEKGDITPFQAFATGLASRVGTGNIVGVGIALAFGGPGAVFWMWMTALVGMSSALIECTLAQLFKVRQPDHTFRGGPAYYIQMGLGQRWLGILFALSLILCFGFIFNAVQTNSIAAVVTDTYGLPDWAVGIVLVALTAPVIFGGMRRIGVVAEFMVPIMAGLYLLLAIYSVVVNITEVPGVLLLIVKSAFGLAPAAGGLAGYAFSKALTMGIKRGLFSNEAGMGSAPNAAAAATAAHPVSQGLLQMLGVAIDTLVVCTATALMILLSGVYDGTDADIGAILTQKALAAEFGVVGGHFLAVAMFFFCFSSIIGNYAYAEGNVDFIRKSPRLMLLFRLAVLGMVYFGAVGTVELVWNMADFSQAIMAIINLVSIILLAGPAFHLLRDFEGQLREGILVPRFTRDRVPEVADKLPKNVW